MHCRAASCTAHHIAASSWVEMWSNKAVSMSESRIAPETGSLGAGADSCTGGVSDAPRIAALSAAAAFRSVPPTDVSDAATGSWRVGGGATFTARSIILRIVAGATLVMSLLVKASKMLFRSSDWKLARLAATA